MSGARYMDGMPLTVDPPQGHDEHGFPIRRCMRSGLCCMTATCTAGLAAGASPKGCKFLLGAGPGEYRCGLVEADPAMAPKLYIGEGCCMPLGNRERYKLVLKRAREEG